MRRDGPLDWDVARVVAACSGAVTGDAATRVEAVTTDSRSVPPGGLFVALRGERFDGHDFVGDAMANGAVAVLVETRAGVDVEPRIEVDDSLEALRALAIQRRDELAMPVVAVTGSTGKTSTKDLLASIMGPECWASPRSFNNEVGVPLTVLSAPPGSSVLVAEVGSRGSGHIAHLVPALRPDVAIITNVGLVHLETLGTPEAVVEAKWELVASLNGDGTAVLPEADERLRRPHRGRTMTFGDAEPADVVVSDLVLDNEGRPAFRLSTSGNHIDVRLQMAGAHQAVNAAAAAAAALAVGRSLDEIGTGLEKATGSPWRMEVHRGRFTVVNDAYNANPDSVASALRTVASMPGRHLAVLGLMAELGPAAEEEHARMGRLARDLGYDLVVVVGEDPGLARGAGSAAHPVATAEAAASLLRVELRPSDVVLVKASRVVGLEQLAVHLVDEAKG